MAVLAKPMIATLFHYGAFTDHDAAASARPLIAYCAGLLGIILVKTLAPAFYAQQDIRTPVRIAIVVLIATQLMNWLFVPYIQVSGLALSIGLGACLNAAFLYTGLRKRDIYRPRPGWPAFCVKLVIACGLMGGVAWLAAAKVDWLGLQHHAFLRVGALLLVVVACAAVYFAALLAMGFRVRDFKRIAR
jgi:putative peptidoglycan lipid II flippase